MYCKHVTPLNHWVCQMEGGTIFAKNVQFHYSPLHLTRPFLTYAHYLFMWYSTTSSGLQNSRALLDRHVVIRAVVAHPHVDVVDLIRCLKVPATCCKRK